MVAAFQAAQKAQMTVYGAANILEFQEKSHETVWQGKWELMLKQDRQQY